MGRLRAVVVVSVKLLPYIVEVVDEEVGRVGSALADVDLSQDGRSGGGGDLTAAPPPIARRWGRRRLLHRRRGRRRLLRRLVHGSY